MTDYLITFWDETYCMNKAILSAPNLIELAQYLEANKNHYQIVVSIKIRKEN